MSADPGPGLLGDATSDPREQAIRRLTASRHQLRSLWLPTAASGRAAGTAGPGLARKLAVLWRRWRMGLIDVPLAGLVMNAASQWWLHNPWRVAGETVADELHQVVTPLVRRHPIATVALAATAGLVLATTKPWRWPWVADPLRAAPARLARWALAQLSQAPLQSLFAGLVLAAGGAVASAGPRPGAEGPAPTDKAPATDPL